MNLKQMLEKATEWETLKSDYIRDREGFEFVGKGMAIAGDLFQDRTLFSLTEHALSQACSKLGPPPFGYINVCPPWLAESNLNYWRERLPEQRQWMLRTFEDEGRAVLSQRYWPIGIKRVLEWMVELGLDNYQIVRPVLTPDYMHLKLFVLGDQDDDNYGYGVYIREGETGLHTYGVSGFIQRISCTNSIIFADDALRVVHLTGRYTYEELRTLTKIHVNTALKTAVEHRNAIARAEAEDIEDFTSVVNQLAKRHGMNEEIRDYVLMGAEGKGTRMGLVNGLSWAAHQQEDHDEAIKMETLAGSILVSEDSLFGSAGLKAEAEMLEVERD